jgi:streptomycin 6-kinase
VGLVDTLREAWTVPLPQSADVKTGLQKANERGWFIEHLWNELEHPCSVAVIDTAKRYCERRAEAFHPQRSIYGHGDPHAGNALRVPAPRPGAASGFVFVDPDGLCVEPAHDLGAIMAGDESELKADDAGELARRWCRSLADATGVEEQAVWEWAFIERVAIGLYALEHGWAWGQEKLDIAERLL